MGVARKLAKPVEGSEEESKHDLSHLGFFDPADPRIDPGRLLGHVRALNAWYADDEPVTLTPEYVSRLPRDAGDPRSEYWDLMRNETIPADSLFSNRMQGMTLAVLVSSRRPRTGTA